MSGHPEPGQVFGGGRLLEGGSSQISLAREETEDVLRNRSRERSLEYNMKEQNRELKKRNDVLLHRRSYYLEFDQSHWVYTRLYLSR